MKILFLICYINGNNYFETILFIVIRKHSESNKLLTEPKFLKERCLHHLCHILRSHCLKVIKKKKYYGDVIMKNSTSLIKNFCIKIKSFSKTKLHLNCLLPYFVNFLFTNTNKKLQRKIS